MLNILYIIAFNMQLLLHTIYIVIYLFISSIYIYIFFFHLIFLIYYALTQVILTTQCDLGCILDPEPI